MMGIKWRLAVWCFLGQFTSDAHEQVISNLINISNIVSFFKLFRKDNGSSIWKKFAKTDNEDAIESLLELTNLEYLERPIKNEVKKEKVNKKLV